MHHAVAHAAHLGRKGLGEARVEEVGDGGEGGGVVGKRLAQLRGLDIIPRFGLRTDNRRRLVLDRNGQGNKMRAGGSKTAPHLEKRMAAVADALARTRCDGRQAVRF